MLKKRLNLLVVVTIIVLHELIASHDEQYLYGLIMRSFPRKTVLMHFIITFVLV